ncbi:MAG: HAMP domain-containing histidine kinase [Clostridiales bacterium]|nr:HAMP domain-containing histidine kinase [Clostridiales bacterium]
MKRLSIRARITLWFSVALILSVALTYFVILSVSRQIIQKTIRDDLVKTVEDNVDEIEYFSSIDLEDLENDVDFFIRYGDGYIEVDDDFLDEVNGVYTSLCQSDGALVYGENPIILESEGLGFADSQTNRVTLDHTLYYIYDRELEAEGLEGLWLRGVVSEAQGEAELSAISRYSLIILPSLVILAIIGGYQIARRALLPIRKIAETAGRISRGDDLKERIELGEGDDELHQLAEQFNEMFARLESSFQAQQQFISDASHELRTPVTVISAQCELTLDEEREPEEYKKALETIQRQSRKMNRLIRHMLDFARLELSPERYARERLNLSEMVCDICEDMALIREKGIALSCEARQDVYVCGNRELLTRLLTNLISNAYRYGKPDGHIRVTLTSDENGAALLVEDDGIGIAGKDLPNIFHRFYQADASRSDGGNGLGLAMVKEIVTFHGGEISVDSSPGRGSRFSVYLPK